jgi:3-methyladenine DNA glycosylase/8-oxoguanine DNA glycosylase
MNEVPPALRHQEDTLPLSDVEAQAIESAALAHLRAVDPVLGRLIDVVGPFTLQRDPSHFYALFSSIVSQQISVRAAATIMSRIEALFPPGEHLTAADVLALGAEPLRAAGLSGMKTRYVLDLSERAVDGRLDLDRLATLDDEAVIAELVQVKGIGRWTAEMFLKFCARVGLRIRHGDARMMLAPVVAPVTGTGFTDSRWYLGRGRQRRRRIEA